MEQNSDDKTSDDDIVVDDETHYCYGVYTYRRVSSASYQPVIKNERKGSRNTPFMIVETD